MLRKCFLFSCSTLLLFVLFSAPLQADTLDTIIERGTLKVGVSLFTPWTMKDSSGQLSGFEIDVAKKMAQDMGVKPQFIVYNWEDIINGLRNGEIDIIAGGMAITPERALKVTFSQSYADQGITLATNTALTRNIKSIDQLNQSNITFSVVTGTVSHEIVPQLFNKATIKTFSTAKQATQAVVDGKAHVYIGSTPEPEFLALKYPKIIDKPLSKPLFSYKSGFAVNKGEPEWLNFLNAWITARTADQWLPTIHKHWFDSIDWQKEVTQK